MSEEDKSLVVGRAVALTTGIEYIPEADAYINMAKFRAQMAIPALERAVVEAAVILAETSDHIDHRDEWEDNEEKLLEATRALLAARQA